MVPGLETIRQIGSHVGKHVVFGYDRYLLPELDVYTQMLAAYGLPVPAVDSSNLHYLSSAERVCRRVSARLDAVGVLICSTGMGMSIAANKFRGVYAARCLSVDDAVMSRVINNANLLCLASKTGAELNHDIVTAFMTTSSSSSRRSPRWASSTSRWWRRRRCTPARATQPPVRRPRWSP